MQLWWSNAAYVFYNDAFIPWLGNRHPSALGRRAAEVFSTQRDLVCRAAESVLVEGLAVDVDGLTLVPLIGDNGQTEGIICTFCIATINDELLSAITRQTLDPLLALSLTAETPALAAAATNLARRRLTLAFDDLLDVVRMARGKLAMTREKIPAAALVERALRFANELSDCEGPDVRFNKSDLSMVVEGDSDRLIRALAQIICEARHSPPVPSSVVVGCRTIDTEVEVSIERIRRSTSSLQTAAAPVLCAMSRHFIEMHGGGVRIDTTHGRDRILVHLPLADESRYRAPTGGRAPRVLLVEDDDANACMLKIALEALGFEVALAHDGPIALEMAGLFAPDAVVLDIGLPVLDGWEVARRLRARVGDVPMIAVTGRADSDSHQRSAESGLLDHLPKPVKLERLRHCLSAIAVPRS